MDKRIKLLRKQLNLSMEQFAHRIGLTRSAISKIESGSNPSEQTIILICCKFNINEEWLRTGNGKMFLPTEANTLEILQKEYHLTHKQLDFISNFLQLPENEKNIILNFFSSIKN